MPSSKTWSTVPGRVDRPKIGILASSSNSGRTLTRSPTLNVTLRCLSACRDRDAELELKLQRRYPGNECTFRAKGVPLVIFLVFSHGLEGRSMRKATMSRALCGPACGLRGLLHCAPLAHVRHARRPLGRRRATREGFRPSRQRLPGRRSGALGRRALARLPSRDDHHSSGIVVHPVS